MFTNTNVICMVTVHDVNRENGIKHVDIGNYFKDREGARCVITTKEFAIKYGHLIDVSIYTRKTNHNSADTWPHQREE